MTAQQLQEQYQIPRWVLNEYEAWQLRKRDEEEYDFRDVEQLSLLLTLHGIGFAAQEAERYMRLALQPDDEGKERLQMLAQRRGAALEEIHLREQQIWKMDFLRHEIQKKRQGGKTHDTE